jgi:hypothetical protein
MRKLRSDAAIRAGGVTVTPFLAKTMAAPSKKG